MTNHYIRLGLKEFSTIDVVKKQYRKLAKVYHPDKNPDNPAAGEKFKLIASSYEILSDPKKKEAYDLQLRGLEVRQERMSFSERQELARKKKAMRRKQEIEMRFAKYENSRFTIKRRTWLALFMMSGVFVYFLLNYFPNYEDRYSMVWLAVSSLLFPALIFLLVDAYYIRKAHTYLKKRYYRFTPVQLASYLFLSLFFLAPIIGIISANLRKNILLNTRTQQTTPLSISLDESNLQMTVQFYANYRSYTCKFDGEGKENCSRKDLVVLYYPGDPRLCKLVKKAEIAP